MTTHGDASTIIGATVTNAIRRDAPTLEDQRATLARAWSWLRRDALPFSRGVGVSP